MSRGFTLDTVMARAILAPHMLWQRLDFACQRLPDGRHLQSSQHEDTTNGHLLLFRKLKCPHNRKRHHQDPKFEDDIKHGCNKGIEVDVAAVGKHLLCKR